MEIIFQFLSLKIKKSTSATSRQHENKTQFISKIKK